MTDRIEKLEALVRQFVRATSYVAPENAALLAARLAAVRLMPTLQGWPNDLAPDDRFPGDAPLLAGCSA